jgi:hypothetical protein
MKLLIKNYAIPLFFDKYLNNKKKHLLVNSYWIINKVKLNQADIILLIIIMMTCF